MGAANLAAAAAFAASGGVPPHMITPELQRLQKQQMELQRLHMASMNHSAAASFGHQNFDAKVNTFLSISLLKTAKTLSIESILLINDNSIIISETLRSYVCGRRT